MLAIERGCGGVKVKVKVETRQAGRQGQGGEGAEVGAGIQPVPGDLGCCGLQAGQPKCQPGSHSTYVLRTAGTLHNAEQD